MEWMNWSNFAYLMVIIMGAIGAKVAIQYKPLVKEAKEVFQKWHEISRDVYQHKNFLDKQWRIRRG